MKPGKMICLIRKDSPSEEFKILKEISPSSKTQVMVSARVPKSTRGVIKTIIVPQRLVYR